MTLNPTTILALRYGFNRFPNFSYDSSQGIDLTLYGFSSSFASQVPRALAQFPYVSMSNLYSLGDSDDNSFYDLSSKNFSASLDKYVGKHSFKVGFDYRRIKEAGNDYNTGGGSYSFNGIFTKSTNTSTGTGGADLADLLLGYPASGSITTSVKLYDYNDYYGLFIQDNYRVNNKLTVNYGVRWERETGVKEANNGLVTNFLTTATNPIAGNVTGILPLGVVQYAGVNGAPNSAGSPYNNKWGPRIGVAYQYNTKTVIRGGYGIFWAPAVCAWFSSRHARLLSHHQLYRQHEWQLDSRGNSLESFPERHRSADRQHVGIFGRYRSEHQLGQPLRSFA